MRLLLLAAIGLAAAPLSAEDVLAPYEDGIAAINASWLLVECKDKDPLRVARCDGFIQGVAAAIEAREFHRGDARRVCPAVHDPAELRYAVLQFMEPTRDPAAEAVEKALTQAYACVPMRTASPQP
jgi:hypothetical protein